MWSDQSLFDPGDGKGWYINKDTDATNSNTEIMCQSIADEWTVAFTLSN